MKKKVIAAGHICLDITPVFPEKTISAVTDILLPGKLIQMGDARIHTGGAVANTGLAMKIKTDNSGFSAVLGNIHHPPHMRLKKIGVL